MKTHAAVVIGVNRTGNLTPLKAAVCGARQVEAWLHGQGFEVTCLVDERNPVRIGDVKEAVKEHLRSAALRQLVIYFAGHGYLLSTSEIWLLSDAPDDPDAAIDQTTSVELARSCDVPSVVFISDACRSNPPSVTAARVWGSSIFPNRASGSVDVEVDRFYAARPGDPALEFAIEEGRRAYVGLFTEMLLRIHDNPTAALTRVTRIGGSDVVVVPSRRLKEALPQRVRDAAQERSITLRQVPQLRLECGDETFISRALMSKDAVPDVPDGSTVAQPEILRRVIVPKRSRGGLDFRFNTARTSRRVGRSAGPSRRPDFGRRGYSDLAYSAELFSAASSKRFEEAADRVLAADATGRSETHTGVQVTGSDVTWAAAVGMRAEILPGRMPTLVRIYGENEPIPLKAGAVVLQFANGAGTVLAGLPGYIASVTVDEGAVVNVSYVPSTNSPLWFDYHYEKAAVERRRAFAATAARNGVLAVDREDAEHFADLLRQGKRFDPTLGLYAALSYADVGLRDRIRSVQADMRRDLGVDLFDVALLAGTAAGDPDPSGRSRPDVYPSVPFCPMLSQSWSFLRARSFEVREAVAEAGRYLVPALWTTFGAEGISILRADIERETRI